MILKKEELVPVVCLILSMLIWGGSFIAIKIAFRTYDPMVVMFGRMAVACLLFLCFFRQFLRMTCNKADWKFFILMGLFEPCLYFTFEAKALSNTSASQAGVITAMLPVLVALAAWMFLNEQLKWKTLSGFMLAVAGAYLLSISGEITRDAPNPSLGNFLEFLAMASATGYAIILKKLSRAYSALLLTAIQVFMGAIYFTFILFLPSTVIPDRIDPQGIAAILFLGAVVTFGAYFLYNYGVSKMTVSRATAFVSLIPIFAVFMGWLILNETLTPIQFFSSGLILIGVFLSQT
ncbi:MAG: DMT family transporter [Proteobacteria bacterium]|nr:DMT family transporter [Pseudomonadota bacterium]